jgi:hypothetical protein
MVEKGERFFQKLVKEKQVSLLRRIGTLSGIDGWDADRLGEMLADRVGIDRINGLRLFCWLERADICGAKAHKTDEN